MYRLTDSCLNPWSTGPKLRMSDTLEPVFRSFKKSESKEWRDYPYYYTSVS